MVVDGVFLSHRVAAALVAALIFVLHCFLAGKVDQPHMHMIRGAPQVLTRSYLMDNAVPQ